MRNGRRMRTAAALTIAALLAACGGGGGAGNVSVPGGSGSTPAPGGVGSTPAPSPGGQCSLATRQQWAEAQIREWYLFPESLATSVNPESFPNLDDFIDALVAPARAQGRDRFFTYVTSIADEDAFNRSGQTAGFGFRLAFDGQRLAVTESFENTPALSAGIDRGAEILAIGTSTGNLRTVSDILASGGSTALNDALGPNTAGTTRALRFRTVDGSVREASVTKTDYALLPVSSRYGARVIDDGGRRVGYLNLRTFISSADAPLRQAFADFRAQGITELVVDLRYNGGGLINTAELLVDLMGRDRTASDILSRTRFRPEKSSSNITRYFRPLPEAVAPMRIAFIGTRASASASELVINAMQPYLRTRMALVGTNTFGKPVGQIGLDRAVCDDRLRVVALQVENADNRGDYYNGLASTLDITCQAVDDLTRPLGDPGEASIRGALDFLAGRGCTPIGASASAGDGSERAMTTRAGLSEERTLVTPGNPDAAQREVPGLF
jgi:carboxyl-terminal processing protease